MTIIGLMAASTCYDIYCTVNERKYSNERMKFADSCGFLFTTFAIFSFKIPVPKARLFMIFSMYTNGRKLLSCKKSTSKDMMNCVHGIRVISTQWVVLGHTYMMFMAMPTVNVFTFMINVSASELSLN